MRYGPKMLVLVLLVTLLAACGDRIRVQIPPKAPVEGIRSIVVLPFDNIASDPALGFEFEQRIAQVLRESGWYDSVTTYRITTAGLGGPTPLQWRSVDDIRRVGRELKADAVIVGTATYYFEDIYMETPSCSGCNRPDAQPIWSVAQRTNVIVRFSASMIDVATGREIHAAHSEGEDVNYLFYHVSWSQREAPPVSLIPQTNRQQVPPTRDTAINRAVHHFTRDLLPTYEWRSVE